VGSLLLTCIKELADRAQVHDASKLGEVEKPIFDKYENILKGLEYGSDAYKAALADMKPALDHHYQANRHHPEHHQNGIRDMNLVDIVEMFCDWKAATERHATGNLEKSVILNQNRFTYSDDLKSIFLNTAQFLEGK
jgi:hypothetical protein